MSSPEELPESELGTQEYWNNLYKTEVINFRDHGDVGEVWFGENISDKIVGWLEKYAKKTDVVLDVGCGNGMLLIELFKLDFKNLHGLDYSKDAIVLAKEVARHYGATIQYTVGDVLKLELRKCIDVLLDKGTYDAISLSSNAKENREMYVSNIYECLKDNGLLVITSCNWSKEELIRDFDGDKFSVFGTIPTPQFKFGGKTGNVVTCMIFKKRSTTPVL